jgi:hypothetical protein
MWHISFFRKLWSADRGSRPTSKPEVIFHDPGSSKPHDLDDPFFDRKVQDRVGRAIADAAGKK